MTNLVRLSQDRYLEILRNQADPRKRIMMKEWARPAMYGGNPDAEVILPEELLMTKSRGQELAEPILKTLRAMHSDRGIDPGAVVEAMELVASEAEGIIEGLKEDQERSHEDRGRSARD